MIQSEFAELVEKYAQKMSDDLLGVSMKYIPVEIYFLTLISVAEATENETLDELIDEVADGWESFAIDQAEQEKFLEQYIEVNMYSTDYAKYKTLIIEKKDHISAKELTDEFYVNVEEHAKSSDRSYINILDALCVIARISTPLLDVMKGEKTEDTLKNLKTKKDIPEENKLEENKTEEKNKSEEKTAKKPKAVLPTAEPKENIVFAGKTDVKDKKVYKLPNLGEIQNNLAAASRCSIGIQRRLVEIVVGQEAAVRTFSKGIAASMLTPKTADRGDKPIAVFLFAGSPGCGKTYLAMEGAKALGIGYKRFDMSEFSSDRSSERLIGFDSTYQASHAGFLTTYVEDRNLQNQKTVLLFDEIEKASIDVLHLFLQILDAGTLMDAYTKKKVSFRNSIIIFTTNAGKNLYTKIADPGNLPKAVIMNAIEADTKRGTNEPAFPPELCSRMRTGYVVMFRQLATHQLVRIASQTIRSLERKYAERYKKNVVADKDIPYLLLLSTGGEIDARGMKALAEEFVTNQLVNLGDGFSHSRFDELIQGTEHIALRIAEKDREILNQILQDNSVSQDILYVSEDEAKRVEFEHKYSATQTSFSVKGYDYDTATELLRMGSIYPELILLDLPTKENEYAEFDYVPFEAGIYQQVKSFLVEVKELSEEIAIHAIWNEKEEPGVQFQNELAMQGVDSILRFDTGLVKNIMEILNASRLKAVVRKYMREQKKLSFSAIPFVSEDAIGMRLNNFRVETRMNYDVLDSAVVEGKTPNVCFDDIIGGTEIKDEMRKYIHYLDNPRRYIMEGNSVPKGLLLYGEPGTGKTYFAEALAHEAGVPFFPTNGSGFVNELAGSGPKAIRELFEKARKYAPSIIFIDEIDAIGKKRQGGSNFSAEETLNMLLSEMDGFNRQNTRPVLVIAATNANVSNTNREGFILDPALVRRFSRTIYVGLPSKADRKEYLVRNLQKELDKNPDLMKIIDSIAIRSMGNNYSDLQHVIDLAKSAAMKEKVAINAQILDTAFETFSYGENRERSDEMRLRTARHEAGHAYIAWRCGKTPDYMTIESRGQFGGYVLNGDNEEGGTISKLDLINQIQKALAGRAAEIVYYGEQEGLSSGASSDIRAASKLVKALVYDLGMSDELQLVYVDANGEESDEVKALYSQKLNGYLLETIDIIKGEKAKLDKLVQSVMDNNKLYKDEIEKILNC